MLQVTNKRRKIPLCQPLCVPRVTFLLARALFLMLFLHDHGWSGESSVFVLRFCVLVRQTTFWLHSASRENHVCNKISPVF